MTPWIKVKFVDVVEPPHLGTFIPDDLVWDTLRGKPVLVKFYGSRDKLDAKELQNLNDIGCTCNEFFLLPPDEFNGESGKPPAVCRAFLEMD